MHGDRVCIGESTIPIDELLRAAVWHLEPLLIGQNSLVRQVIQQKR